MGMTQSSCWAMISMRVHISTHSPAAVDALRLHALLVGVKKRINKKKEKRNEGFSDEIRKKNTNWETWNGRILRSTWLAKRNAVVSFLVILFSSFILPRSIYLFFILIIIIGPVPSAT